MSCTAEHTCLTEINNGESCGTGPFCCEGDCNSDPQCGEVVCCFGEVCEAGECCRAIDCVNLGYGDNQACVSCTAAHACLTEVNNGEICEVDPDAVCCSGFCTLGTTCLA